MWSSSQIEIQYDNADAAKLPLELISNIRESFDCCIDDEGRALLTENEKLWIAIKALISKGVIVRFVTAVNERNIAFCRELMKCGKVFHNDSVIGNFQIVDRKDYLCYITGNEVHATDRELHWQLFHTNFKSFVEIQQCLFDNLCKAIPAIEKIKEIEKGIRTEFTDTINHPAKIKEIVTNLLMSAKGEILLLFPTTNTFYRAKSSGLLNSLRQLSSDVSVRVLVQVGHNNHEVAIRNELKQSHGQIQVQYVTKPLTNRIMTVVVDQVASLAIEIDDDTKNTFEEASGTAIYSSSELIVSSCISIFETLWIQSEVDKQNKIKQAYFQMFKGLRMKEEYYTVDRLENGKEK